MSVDATFKDGDTNDYVAIQVWGKRNNKEYLIDRLKERMDFPTTMAVIKTMKAKYPTLNQIVVEDKANGSAIISMLRKELQGIVAVNPLGGKIARANAVAPMIEAGDVYLPQNATWIHDFVDEWSSFPNSQHDDEVDCGTQALSRLRNINADIRVLTEEEELKQKQWKEKVKGIAGQTASRSFINY
jgi:predicted phage terminase large subunit-like protein